MFAGFQSRLISVDRSLILDLNTVAALEDDPLSLTSQPPRPFNPLRAPIGLPHRLRRRMV